MISSEQIDAKRERDGVDRITALKSGAIRKLGDRGALRGSARGH
jgi:hypothetical protein